MIKIENISKSFDQIKVVDNIISESYSPIYGVAG